MSNSDKSNGADKAESGASWESKMAPPAEQQAKQSKAAALVSRPISVQHHLPQHCSGACLKTTDM